MLQKSHKNAVNLNIPPNTIIDVDVMHNYTDDQIMILTTGSQGEPMAGLSRMATSNHRTVELAPNDTVIISATPIPGNEGAVGRTIDNLLRLGLPCCIWQRSWHPCIWSCEPRRA